VAGEGVFVLFNAPTNGAAARHIESDPVVSAKGFKEVVCCPVNEQDVDGLHHAMPRTYSEQAQLDQIHYMNPQDILTTELPPLPSLPNHHEENMQALAMILELGESFRYFRFNETKSYERDMEEAEEFNKSLETFQKVRLQSMSDLYGADGMEMIEEMEESYSGDE